MRCRQCNTEFVCTLKDAFCKKIAECVCSDCMFENLKGLIGIESLEDIIATLVEYETMCFKNYDKDCIVAKYLAHLV